MSDLSISLIVARLLLTGCRAEARPRPHEADDDGRSRAIGRRAHALVALGAPAVCMYLFSVPNVAVLPTAVGRVCARGPGYLRGPHLWGSGPPPGDHTEQLYMHPAGPQH